MPEILTTCVAFSLEMFDNATLGRLILGYLLEAHGESLLPQLRPKDSSAARTADGVTIVIK